MGKIFRPQTIQEAVLAELRRLISDGELRPGTVIRLDAVARALEVSRIPVREALKVLEGEGLVTHRPRGDYEVPSLRAEEIHEIYRLRALLESEALHSLPGQPDEQDCAAARAAIAAAERDLAAGDANAFSGHAREFHKVTLRACAMPRLLRLLDGLWDTTETYRPAKFVDSQEWATLQAEHRAMLAAFVGGDRMGLDEVTGRHREHLLAATLRGTTPTSAS